MTHGGEQIIYSILSKYVFSQTVCIDPSTKSSIYLKVYLSTSLPSWSAMRRGGCEPVSDPPRVLIISNRGCQLCWIFMWIIGHWTLPLFCIHWLAGLPLCFYWTADDEKYNTRTYIIFSSRLRRWSPWSCRAEPRDSLALSTLCRAVVSL